MNHKISVFGKGLEIRPLLSELNLPPQTALAPAQPGHQDELISIDMKWLERFPNLSDLTYVTRKAHYNWWIGGEYRVHGPDVVSRPAEGCKWHGEPEKNINAAWVEDYLEGNPKDQGLEYYEKMGICDDTGTTWAFDGKNSFAQNIWQFAWQRRLGVDPGLRETYAYTDKRRDTMIHKYSDNASAAVPKIGLRGYSYNTSSCGGFWAGYRLYVGNHPRLEFSPLAWDDVKEYLESFQTYEDNREDAEFGKEEAETVSKRYKHGKDIKPSSPETIVKITIIRPGEEAPRSHPHHCWEPVAGDFNNCDDLQGVDWRQVFPVNPPPVGKEFKKFMAPGFNRRLSDEDNMLLCSREEKLLKNLNRFRIRQIFYTVMRGIYGNHKAGLPAPYHFHESEVPSGSTN
ncbi:unnamed protein product [Clonostachys rhizophaga]|uniref:Uncharacterized protein n=1 Tax=Clonostachys rhizophaga TaxID=160324 RepID=A0A9N9VTV6_9HYPO|nr:unnamed protein product [Clonostachys rhizophaga]